MKKFVVFILFICLPFMVFSQSNRNNQNTKSPQEINKQRYQTLGDEIGRTADTSSTNLKNYDDLVLDNGQTRNYLEFQRRHRSLTKALKEKEDRLDFEIKTNGRSDTIREERDKYEVLVQRAEDLKSEYDEWVKKTK